MDLNDLPEGAGGGALVLAVWLIGQWIRRRINGAKFPCSAHEERIKQLEQRTAETRQDLKEATASQVIILTAQGKELASLQARIISIGEGIVRIEVQQAEIEKLLREHR